MEDHHSREASLTSPAMTLPTVPVEHFNHEINPSCCVTNHDDSNFNIDQDQNCESSFVEDEYFDSFPPGYRFKPQDHELIVHYLDKKIQSHPLPPNRISDVELYTKNPATLTAECKCNGDNEWYFFTPRNRKYPHGERPNRAAGNGFWKATGADKAINSNGARVGYKKSLVFYEGKPPRGDRKTDWMMQEYRLHNPPPKTKGAGIDMLLDKWVLCKVYKKKKEDRARQNLDNAEEDHNIDEHPLRLPLPTNEIPHQTPMLPVSPPFRTGPRNPILPVSLPYETTLGNPVLPNPLEPEKSVMFPNFPADQARLLPNHVNQMEHLNTMGYVEGFQIDPQYPNFCGRGKEMAEPVFYPLQQPSFVQAQNDFHDQKIPTHNLLMPMWSHARYAIQQQFEEYHHFPDPFSMSLPSTASHYSDSSFLSNDGNIDPWLNMDQNNCSLHQSPLPSATKGERFYD